MYFPRCIWCLRGPFLERKLKRLRHLQSTLRRESSAADLSLSAIIQESYATPRGAILIKLESLASLSTRLQHQPFSCVYGRHILPGTLFKHISILQINTQQWSPNLFSSLFAPPCACLGRQWLCCGTTDHCSGGSRDKWPR